MDTTHTNHQNRVVGKNQSVRAIRSGAAFKVYIAHDADPELIGYITELCQHHSVSMDSSQTLLELGASCGIEVGCAVCALLEEPLKR